MNFDFNWDLLGKISIIASIVAAVITVIGFVVLLIVSLCRLVKKAKDPSSDGGEEITEAERKEIVAQLLPTALRFFEIAKEIVKKNKKTID